MSSQNFFEGYPCVVLNIMIVIQKKKKKKKFSFIKVLESEETFLVNWLAVRRNICWYYIYIFKTIRHVNFLEKGMCCKFEKTGSNQLLYHCLKLTAQFHMYTLNALLVLVFIYLQLWSQSQIAQLMHLLQYQK